MGFPRHEYWGRLPFPPPEDLPDSGIKLASPALAGGFFTTELLGKPLWHSSIILKKGDFWVSESVPKIRGYRLHLLKGLLHSHSLASFRMILWNCSVLPANRYGSKAFERWENQFIVFIRILFITFSYTHNLQWQLISKLWESISN